MVVIQQGKSVLREDLACPVQIVDQRIDLGRNIYSAECIDDIFCTKFGLIVHHALQQLRVAQIALALMRGQRMHAVYIHCPPKLPCAVAEKCFEFKVMDPDLTEFHERSAEIIPKNRIDCDHCQTEF